MKDGTSLLHHNNLEMLMPVHEQNILFCFGLFAFIEENSEGVSFLFKLGVFH
ncbi:hypothetical protein D3C75_1353880 [compost metagenome]